MTRLIRYEPTATRIHSAGLRKHALPPRDVDRICFSPPPTIVRVTEPDFYTPRQTLRRMRRRHRAVIGRNK
jgi:hypothetical protein